MNLVFATNNKHKIEEVQQLLQTKIHLLSLGDIHCNEELPETGNTLEENASQKTNYVHKKFGTDCFADDTGLEIEALNGKPGVLSARYAGEKKDSDKNIQKVLQEMKNIKNRKARFRTIISLIIGHKEYLFEGIVDGIIAEDKHGEKGFGYDPIFIPQPLPPSPAGEGLGVRWMRSFAEMSLEEKNTISHRAIAVRKLADFLNRV
ncbi:MAG: non-canonical purine NTP diphosphatase [Bacteroidetes bacterium]|nr:non-canonical purine NTP diphosphatase [Bacteroidota bacterium]